MNPTVSIVVTAYKRTNFIAQAIDSALGQTYTDFEIIVTDDSNSIEIGEICKSYADPRIRYRANEKNIGVVENIKTAISESKGNYISILNDDDYWDKAFLSTLMKQFENKPSCALVFSNHWILEKGEIDYKITEEIIEQYHRNAIPAGEVQDLEELVLQYNGVPLAMSSVFKKSAIDFNLLYNGVKGAYDFWISCLILKSNPIAIYVKENLTYYRRHVHMETIRKSIDKNENMVFVFKILSEENWFPKNEKLINKKYSESLSQVGFDHLHFNSFKTARNYFIDSLKVKPSSRGLMGLVFALFPFAFRLALKLKA